MKKLITTEDFPLDAPDTIKADFKSVERARITTRIVLESLFSIIETQLPDSPWLSIPNKYPELSEFITNNPDITVVYNYSLEKFTIKPKKALES